MLRTEVRGAKACITSLDVDGSGKNLPYTLYPAWRGGCRESDSVTKLFLHWFSITHSLFKQFFGQVWYFIHLWVRQPIEKFQPSGTINLDGKCISLRWLKVFDCFYMEVVSVEASSFGSPHHKFPAAICMNQPCQGVHVCIYFELQSSAWTLGRGVITMPMA